MREIPGEDAGTNLVKKFREDCNVHTAAQCCITTGVLTGVAYLDTKLTISVEEDGEMVDDVELSLRDVLTSAMAEGKPLFRVVVELDDSTVMVISATSPERDAFLANICQCTAAWTMYTMVFTQRPRQPLWWPPSGVGSKSRMPRPSWSTPYMTERRAWSR